MRRTLSKWPNRIPPQDSSLIVGGCAQHNLERIVNKELPQTPVHLRGAFVPTAIHATT